MANIAFTINNISSGTLTYQDQAILSGNSYMPDNTAQSLFASDPGLIADLIANLLTITIGAHTWGGLTAVEVLKVIQLSPIIGNVASGDVDSGNPVKVGGIININGSLFSNAQRADTQMNTAGSIYVDNSGRLSTYSACISGLTIAASATDIFTITGSASKIIRITRISVTGSTTSGSGILASLQLIKRSAANTGGTSSVLTKVPHDSTSTAATAVVRSYTTNPTLGTAVGTIRAERAAFESTSAVPSRLSWDFGTRGARAITLVSDSEVLSVNLNATTITGGSFSIDVEWIEE